MYNKIKILFIMSIILGTSTTTKQPMTTSQTAENLTNAIFDPFNVHIDSKDFYKIKNLIQNIMQLSSFDKHEMLSSVLEKVNVKFEKAKKSVTSLQKKGADVPLATSFQLYLLRVEKEHIQSEAKKSNGTHSLTKGTILRVKHYIEVAWKRICDLFYDKKDKYNKNTLSQTSQMFVDYVEILNEKVFTKYETTLAFFVNQKIKKLPSCMDFFQNPDIRTTIKENSQILGSKKKAKTQFLEMIAMAALCAASNYSNMWISAADQKEAAKEAAKQTQMMHAETTFLKAVYARTKTLRKNIGNQLTEERNILSKKYGIMSERHNEESTYLHRSVNNSPSKKLYLVEGSIYAATADDEIFSAAIMETPNNDYKWFNWHQHGDWEYCSETNSFFQNTIETYTNTGTYNGIFVSDYIPTNGQYIIEAGINLIDVSYPFFAGIMFNKARFIPGNPERFDQFRILGLYGTQSDPKDPNTREITLQFAQQKIEIISGQERIHSPLEELGKLDTSKDYYYKFSSPDVQALDIHPQSYILQIIPGETSLRFSLTKNGAGSSLISKTITIPTLQPTMYHDIGFMAPGCAAEFKLTKPEALTFTKKTISDYQKTERGEIEQYKNTI